MGLSLKINEARITGFKLLSYESKKVLKDFSQVCEGKLVKGGEGDIKQASVMVINDIQRGKVI